MKRTVLFWILITLPFILIVLVNATSITPSEEYRKERCTRYCHSYGCLHTVKKFQNTSPSLIKDFAFVYKSTIDWLGHSRTGLNYREMNLALYVGFAPFVMSLLLWGALKKSHGKNN